MKQNIPIFVLATISGTQADVVVRKSLEELFISDRVSRMNLPVLSPVEVVHFIQSLLSLTPDVASRIETICGGKPKVAVELIAEWIQQGALVSTADGYELREGFEVNIPDSLLEIWINRYQKLRNQWLPEELLAFEIMGCARCNRIST